MAVGSSNLIECY